MKRSIQLATMLSLAATPALATDEVVLPEITVKGQGFSAKDNPYSAIGFGQEDFRDRQVSHPEQLFREVPGMEVRNLQYGSVANSIVLRGFGGGGHGGDIGFAIDGIPLNEAASHADGYADLGVLIPQELEEMTVYRGPVSALYGNYNRAGSVILESRKGGRYLETDLKYGSFKTLDAQVAAGGKLGAADANVAFQVVDSDGFRPDTAARRATVAGHLAFALSADTRLALSSRVHNARADTASVITEDQYRGRVRDFYDRDPNVQNDGTDKDFSTLRADLSHAIAPDLRLLAFAYGTHQTFTRYFTRLVNATDWRQRMEDYVRDVTGFGANLNSELNLAGSPLRWVAGVERYQESTDFKYADYLDHRRYTAATVAAGSSGTQDRRLAIDTTAAFAQAEWALSPYFRPTLGLRHDRIEGGCDRRGVESVTGANAQCNDMPAMSKTSPKLGVRSTLLPALLEARVSHARGFQLPGTSSGQAYTVGLDVGPTTFRQNEAGVTWTPHRAFFVDLVGYEIKSSGEIQAVPAGSLNYENVGSTRRRGIEAEVRFMPNAAFELVATLARTRSRIMASATASNVGEAVTGVPSSLATLTAVWRPVADYDIALTHRRVGRYPLNLPNTVYYEGYRVFDLMVSHEIRNGAGRQRWYARIDNLTDREYATSAGLSSGVRTYNIGSPRALTLGVSLDF
jgi:outer membrane receptor protein involved in Fe transport